MSTDVMWQTDCSSLEQSLVLAEKLGQKLTGQTVIELISDIGGGKTTFVRGLAQGIASDDHVSSPTFTLNNIYHGPELTIHHYDFYRLFEPGIMRDELTEVLTDPQAVVVVEWADIVHDVLPDKRLTIRITNTGEHSRRYEFIGGDTDPQLIAGLA